MLRTLVNLGFTETDSEIYLLLVEEGPQKGKNMAKALTLQRQQLYRSLKRLMKNGAVHASLERPARYSAVSLEIVLDFLIKTKKAQALALQKNKEELLSGLRAITGKE